MIYPAHIRREGSNQIVQTATDHSKNTARYASECLADIQLNHAAEFAGLLHDCGKFKREFAQYLNNANGIRGSVNHTFAGVRLILDRYHGQDATPEKLLSAELLAYAVGAHHGLFDCIDEKRNSGFEHRKNDSSIGYAESIENFVNQCVSLQELDKLFEKANQDLMLACQKITDLIEDDVHAASFQIFLLSRLLLSAVIEGDRRDTAEFMRCTYNIPTQNNMQDFWLPYLVRVDKKVMEFPKDTDIAQARQQISNKCRNFAEKVGGIYRLNVPTGSGKTLSSLRYALAHAQKWNKRRLIFVSPLLSILEQNAAVIREFLGDDRIVLEHHSNVLQPEEAELDLRELAVENWHAPVVITTLVQLLNTLFDGKTTSIRRFHSICNSVVVIDEVQTVPHKMLSLFNHAMDFLTSVCNTTVLLCSATQPRLEMAQRPIRQVIEDVVPFDPVLWKIFCRTKITDRGGMTLEEIGAFAQSALKETQSLLVVCNKKDEAEYLFGILRNSAEESCHLSASMCVAHRRKVLYQLNEALKTNRKCLCVATQVIEAGVDISFGRVIRLSAGMDSVVQAAGRCNRHGEQPHPAKVDVVNCLNENLRMLQDIQTAKTATVSLMDAYKRHPDHFGNDLSSERAIATYYQRLYTSVAKEYQDFFLERQRTTLFALLSCNERYYNENASYAGEYMMNQSFKMAGKAFRVFDSNTRDVVVPYEDGIALIAELTAQEQLDPVWLSSWEKRVRPYTVSVYGWQLECLGNGVFEHMGIAVLLPEFYDECVGLILKPKENDFLEV